MSRRIRIPRHADAALIAELGGVSALARALEASLGLAEGDIRPLTVQQWKVRGIPAGMRMAVAAVLLAKGLAVPEGFTRPKLATRGKARAANDLPDFLEAG